MSRILVIDDNRTRQDAFRQYFSHDRVEVADTVESAERLLTANKWDLVFLNHDLDERRTGYNVVTWLTAHPEHQPRMLVAHSMDPERATQIKSALPYAQLFPDGWTQGT